MSIGVKKARTRRAELTSGIRCIDVENWPKDVIAGKDPQLERAVDEAMRLLKAKPIDRLTAEPPPTWGKRKGSGSN